MANAVPAVQPAQQQTFLPSLVTGNVAAAGNNQASATALTVSVLNKVTAADGIKGVVLPANQPGQITGVYNADGNNAVLVYPPANGTISKNGGNNAVAVAPGQAINFTAIDGTEYSAAAVLTQSVGPRQQQSKYTTSTQANATAAQGLMTGADFVVAAFTVDNANGITTRTAAQLFADIPGATVGTSYMLRVLSKGNATLTLTGGAGVTITGTATIATVAWRDYVVSFTGSNAVTLTNSGAGSSP